MKFFLIRNLVIFSSLFLVSCVAKNNEPPQIRIVDMQGKTHNVVTKIPELNSQALASQGMQERQAQNNFLVNQQAASKQNVMREADFGAASSQSIQQTLQPQQFSKPSPRENEKDTANSVDNAVVVAGSGVAASNAETIEYDLSETKAAPQEEDEKPQVKKSAKKVTAKKHKAEAAPVVASKGGKKFFVQVGSFTNRGNADNSLSEMKKFHSGKIEVVEGEKTVYRVLLGPFPNKAKATAMVSKITNTGHAAILVRSK